MVLAVQRTKAITISIAATLNGESIRGNCHGWYDPVENRHGGRFEFGRARNDLILIRASAGSAVSWTICLYSRAVDGSANLVQILDGPFTVDLDYTIVDEKGRMLAQWRGDAACSDPREDAIEGEFCVEGFVEGDLHAMGPEPEPDRGYAVYLHQEGPGLIFGLFAQTIPCQAGRYVNVLGRRRYHYASGGRLPFDEVQHYYLTAWEEHEPSSDGILLTDFEATSFYGPADARRVVN